MADFVAAFGDEGFDGDRRVRLAVAAVSAEHEVLGAFCEPEGYRFVCGVPFGKRHLAEVEVSDRLHVYVVK